jgi:hypothetical protein
MDEQEEIKKQTEEIVNAYLEKRKKPAMIAYGILFVAIFIFWIYINSDTSYSSSSSPSSSSTPSSSYSGTSSSTSSYSDTSSNPNEYAPGVTVVATPVVLGDNLIIRTRVNNRNSYPINKKIRLFAEDVRGVQYIVDIIHADLEPNQVGNSTSSIPLSKVGTPPHKIVVD